MKLNLIDTHAHLNFPDYLKDLDQVIKRSTKNDVTKIICVSSNLADSERAIKLAKKYPKTVYAAVGIHPHQTDHETTFSPEEQIKNLTKLVENNEVIAIGECGLDYSPAPPGEKDRTKEEQLFLFKEQIKIAKTLDLPLIVHTRKSFVDTVQMIKDGLPTQSGIFHCYSAGKKGIEKVSQTGFYFGIAGNLTYDLGLQNVVKEIPLEKIVLETDCPFLAPEPKRGSRNEPANVKIIAECLAKVKNITLEEVTQITSQNAKKIFKI